MKLMLRVLQYYHGKICEESDMLFLLCIITYVLTVCLNHVDWNGYVVFRENSS